MTLIILWLVFWSFVVFVLGIVVGSFLNVCIARLPLEKSLIWPNSRCGHCFQSIPWYDNFPLVAYVWLRGRCRKCGASYSMRYFFVELLTGLGVVGLFWLEVVLNVHDWPELGQGWGRRFGIYPWEVWAGFIYHSLLFAFLMAAAFCDLQGRIIPLSITLTGTIVGLVGAVLMPWPWPYTPAEALSPILSNQVALNQAGGGWWALPPGVAPKSGVYPWPVWGPLPEWLQPGGNWQTGLATGLAGMLAGTVFMRLVAFLFSKGLGKQAMGLGDADLMMMAGAFLGWQPIVVAFFVSVIPGLFVGIFQLIFRNDDSLPFGPSLALGVLITLLTWRWLGPPLVPLLFFGQLLIALAVIAGILMFVMAYMLGMMRPPPKPSRTDSESESETTQDNEQSKISS